MLWWSLRGLKSPDPETRKQAAEAAGASGKRGAVPKLLEALSDQDPGVRAAAIQALGRLGDARAVAPLAAFLTNAKERASKSDARGAALALAEIGVPALEPLLAALQSGHQEARRSAAEALGRLHDPRALEPLTRALNDSRSDVRQAAASALGDLGDPAALKALAPALSHKDPETRRAAAEAAGKLGGEDAIRLLARAVEDSEESVQMAAVEGLGKVGGTKAALGLKPAVRAARKSVREAAVFALRRMSFTEATPDERAAVAVLAGDFRAAVREGAAAVAPLTEALGGPDASYRRQAASALESFKDPRAIPALVRALRDYDAEVRETASRALAGVGSEAVAPLIEVLESPDVTAQTLAARALGQVGDARAVRALVGCIVSNRSARTYLEPLEAARAAHDALSSILSSSADNVPSAELQRVSSLPDAVRESEPGEGIAEEIAVDCSDLRTLSRLELDRRT